MSSSVEPKGFRAKNGVENTAFNGPEGAVSTMEMGNVRSKTSRQMSSFQEGSTLSAHDIRYSVELSGGPPCKKKEEKKILHGVTGIFKPGMNAILGPTGCGKSSFLDVLAGRKDMSRVTGQLLVDSQELPDNFKCMVGYVVQDDVVMGTLTIRENFAFSASLRMTGHISERERKDRVEEVIQELGLSKCADTKVGNEFIRGVSGGERKRCNIGMELITSPPVLFLDEPTTGLDANTSNSVLHLLRRLSRRGRTIIFSIHQPRFTIYKMFDSIMLLSKGETVYHGPSAEALNYFAEQGFQCEAFNNPPDFFLDVINGDPLALAGDTDEDADLDEEAAAIGSMHDKLIEGFKVSQWQTRLNQEADAIVMKYEKEFKGQTRGKIDYASSFPRQFVTLAGRTLRNITRNPQILFTTFGTTFFFAFIVSAIFWQAATNKKDGFRDRSGALFFLVMNQLFINMPAVELFINERKLFMHENISGYYRASVYFTVKVFCDMLPLRLVPLIILATISYFTVDFHDGAGHFFIFALTLFGATVSAASLCFFLSAAFGTFAVAQLVLALCFVLMMLLSGFLVAIDSIGEWLRWAQYVSIMKYAVESLYMNEFRDVTFCDDDNIPSTCKNGTTYLSEQDMTYNDSWDIWFNIMMLAIIALVLLTLTYLRLRFMKKTS